jgi:hypothetical protein
MPRWRAFAPEIRTSTKKLAAKNSLSILCGLGIFTYIGDATTPI